MRSWVRQSIWLNRLYRIYYRLFQIHSYHTVKCGKCGAELGVFPHSLEAKCNSTQHWDECSQCHWSSEPEKTMINSDGVKITMKLFVDELFYTGKPISLPTVTLASETGVKYAENEDYTLTYYQVDKGADGELSDVKIAKEDIKDIGVYKIIAATTGNGKLLGEAQVQFVINPPLLGDVNQDGEVNITDATTLKKYLAEYELPYPVGKPISYAAYG